MKRERLVHPIPSNRRLKGPYRGRSMAVCTRIAVAMTSRCKPREAKNTKKSSDPAVRYHTNAGGTQNKQNGILCQIRHATVSPEKNCCTTCRCLRSFPIIGYNEVRRGAVRRSATYSEVLCATRLCIAPLSGHRSIFTTIIKRCQRNRETLGSKSGWECTARTFYITTLRSPLNICGRYGAIHTFAADVRARCAPVESKREPRVCHVYI